MTTPFDQLQAEPQTDVDLGQLAPEERGVVRRIKIQGTSGHAPATETGGFTTVFYVVGDERAAAERFVAENEAELESLVAEGRLTDAGHNDVSTSVDREVFDWILHALGLRRLQTFETVVIEWRPEEDVTWCISRRLYEDQPSRRYSVGSSGSARVGGSLSDLYAEVAEPGGSVTESDLEDSPIVAGDVRQVLDAFRQAERFAASPTSIDGELAVRTHDAVEPTPGDGTDPSIE